MAERERGMAQRRVEALEGVTRAWYEWVDDGRDTPKATLVVEVSFDIAPDVDDLRTDLLEDIRLLMIEEASVHRLRVVSCKPARRKRR